MKSIGSVLYENLRKCSKDECVVDYSLDTPIHITKFQLLTIATAFSEQIKSFSGDRIGIAIPPSGAGIIANLAVIFAGKIPVNLNFANKPSINEHCIQTANINCILTVSALKLKFPEFPWTSNTIQCDIELKKIKNNKLKLLKYAFLNKLPVFISKQLLLKNTKTKECALLFTSGSSGNPKGVQLSHMNILSNVFGIQSMNKFPNNSKILANLPLFHSFGFTVTMLYPLISNIKIVTVPSPLDVNKALLAIEQQQVNVLLGTPTFLRGYLRRGTSNKLRSVKYVIAGAEKSSSEFITHWENFTNCEYLEGYGLTETSPVLSLNTPNKGIKKGSVGKLLPDIFVKTIHPETHEPLGRLDTGILCFKGPNIFMGYLNDEEKTSNAFVNEDWFVTGDIGRMDEDGFIHIEGRLSRFSKIGGEMIPHETIEKEAVQILDLNKNDDISLVVTARPHETKGEELILITSVPIEFDYLKSRLSEKFSNLFIPKIHKKIDEIPVLPTGKLDLQSIKELVNEK